jgi:hypothetical protein
MTIDSIASEKIVNASGAKQSSAACESRWIASSLRSSQRRSWFNMRKAAMA